MSRASVDKAKKVLKKRLLCVVRTKKDCIVIANDIAPPAKLDVTKLQKKLPKKTRLVMLSELWDSVFEGKKEFLSELLGGKKLYDSNFLGRLKHLDELIKASLEKFGDYIFSVVLFGSTARGQAKKESDIDVAFIVDDTDLRNMTRTEAKDKLHNILSATAVQIFKHFNVQTYLLSQFWIYVRDAHPVIFTVLRDGVPFFDKGLFSPWRILLKEGEIKPTAEAIDKMLLSGSVFVQKVNQVIANMITEELYYAMLNPSQAALMLYGLPPMTYKETPILLRKVFVKNKMLEEKYVKWLGDIIKLRKDLEAGKRKMSEFNAAMLKEQSARCENYIKRMLKLFDAIRKENFAEDVKKMEFLISESIKKAYKASARKAPKKAVYTHFKKNFIDTGDMHKSEWNTLKYFENVKKAFEKDKLTKQELSIAKDMLESFIRDVDYYVAHPKVKKTRQITAHMRFKHQEGVGDLWIIDRDIFIVPNIKHPEIKILAGKLTKTDKITEAKKTTFDSFMRAKSKAAPAREQRIADSTIESMKKLFKDVEIIL
jgi:predicted nucleotidyltransferase/uncharacterized protein (UPF0332 family)